MPAGSTRLVTLLRPKDAVPAAALSPSLPVAFSTARLCVGSITPAEFGEHTADSPPELPSTRLKARSGAANGGLHPGASMLGTLNGMRAPSANCFVQDTAWDPANTPSSSHPMVMLVPIATYADG